MKSDCCKCSGLSTGEPRRDNERQGGKEAAAFVLLMEPFVDQPTGWYRMQRGRRWVARGSCSSQTDELVAQINIDCERKCKLVALFVACRTIISLALSLSES